MASTYSSLAIAGVSFSSPSSQKNGAIVAATKNTFMGGRQLKVSKFSAPSGRRSVTVWASAESEPKAARAMEKAGEFLDDVAKKGEEIKDGLLSKAEESADEAAKKDQENKDFVAQKAAETKEYVDAQAEEAKGATLGKLDELKDAISGTDKK